MRSSSVECVRWIEFASFVVGSHRVPATLDDAVVVRAGGHPWFGANYFIVRQSSAIRTTIADKHSIDRFVYVGSGFVYPDRSPDNQPYQGSEMP